MAIFVFIFVLSAFFGILAGIADSGIFGKFLAMHDEFFDGPETYGTGDYLE